MAGQVETVNRALFKLGSLPIMSMGDNSKQARVMSGLWDTVRKAELRRHLWGFAQKRANLPSLADTPAWGFARAFQLPADSLRVFQINDFFISPSMMDYRDQDDSAWAIENNQILTDFDAPLKIRYIADITDSGAFDALFVESIASKLAYEACESLTQSDSKKQAAGQDYNAAIKAAYMVNACERPPQGIADDSFILARL